jgi:hypothetical protein
VIVNPMHCGFPVGAGAIVIVKLVPALIDETYGAVVGGVVLHVTVGDSDPPFVALVSTVKLIWLFAVIAVVFTVTVVAAAATVTVPDGALPQDSGEVPLTRQLEVVII